MNEFDDISVKRTRLGLDIVTTWAQFRKALFERVDSYNKLAEGIEHAAKIDSPPASDSIVISCPLGLTREEGYAVAVVVTVSCVQAEYRIDVQIEKWVQPGNSKRKAYRPPKSVRFELQAKLSKVIGFAPGSPTAEIWLECDGKKMTVAEAAQEVLDKVLAVIRKRSFLYFRRTGVIDNTAKLEA
jgi:hypothetical protein